MKTLGLFILVSVLFLAGCNRAAVKAAEGGDIYVCQYNSDCVSIPKGCCQCDGVQVVNQTSAPKIIADTQAKCENTMCTMQYCFNEVNAVCNAGKCEGKAVAYPKDL